jgi:myo-inositol-1(or 4)-monophosphatase
MLPTLTKALKAAGEIQLKNFKAFNHSVKSKESISSIVTEVDVECEAGIIEIIENAFPNHNILSEETGFKNHDSDFTWVIDPLDGTSNYVAGLPWFGVLVALLQNDKPILAGAYLPVEDKMYLAEKGKGATVNGQSINMVTLPLEQSLCAFSTDYTSNEAIFKKGLDIFGFLTQNTRNVRSTNSLVDLMMVAEGRFGGGVNMFSCIWDIAAPYLIIKEAGGTVKDINSSALDFHIGEDLIKKNYPYIAGSDLFVSKVLATINFFK